MSPKKNKKIKVLISGGGIAGLTTAYWLQNSGFEVVVVEKAPSLRLDGYMIDYFGAGYTVGEKMEILDHLRKDHYEVKLYMVDAEGKKKFGYNYSRFQQACDGRFMSFLRSDLEEVLYEKLKNLVEIRFGTSVKKIKGNEQNKDPLKVIFEDGKEEAFDLIVGADGFHSNLRDQIFEKNEVSKDFLNHYCVCFKVKNDLEISEDFYSYSIPGKQASVYPLNDGDLAAFFLFKSKKLGRLSQKEIEDLVIEKFGDSGWKFSEIAQKVKDNDSLFFDSLTQISMPKWYKNRVVLVGDACQCLTLIAGQGASMAMSGSYLLAEVLKKWKDDGADFENLPHYYQKYQDLQRPESEKRRKKAKKMVKYFVPDSKWKIFLRNIVMRVVFLKPLSFLLRKALNADDFLSDQKLI